MSVRVVAALVLAALPAFGQAAGWKSMFDGKSLSGWKETPFTNHGTVTIENGTVVLSRGKPMTGITWTGEFPKSGYEVRFEAMRVEGNDFFASLTFPVGDSFATFVSGGWGGDIIGVSSIDGWDASENETRAYFNFEDRRWYRFRLNVTIERIRVFIDDEQVVNLNIAGRTMGLRHGEIKLSAPFGFASYGTKGALRAIEYRITKP